MKNKIGLLVSIMGVILGASMILGLASGSPLYASAGDENVTDIKLNDIYTKKDDCSLWVSFQNTGTTQITATLRVKVTVQNVTVENVLEQFDLAPNQYFNTGVGPNPGYKLLGTNKSVTAWIDADNTLAESDETNNSMTKTLSCSLLHAALAEKTAIKAPGGLLSSSASAPKPVGKPDLCIPYIKFVVVHEGDDAAGHYVTFNAIVYVKNVGPVGAGPFDTLLEHHINGVGPYLTCPTCKIHWSGLSAGQGVELPARQFTKRGTQTSGEAIFFRATADCDKVITESDETNNECKDSYQGQALHK